MPDPDDGAADKRPGAEPSGAVASMSVCDETPIEDLPDALLYINRELSLLDFFERVLDEARDRTNPLLERLKFIGIAQSVLGEFFMVRMAGLRQQVDAGVTEAVDGFTPQQLLPVVRERALGQMRAARQAFSLLLPELEAAGIHIANYGDLTETQHAALRTYYETRVFPVLTPLAFDPGRPFPHISNMSHNLAVVVRDQSGEEHFARVKVPTSLPRLVVVPPGDEDDGHWFTWLEQLIAAHLDSLFPGMEVVESSPFRVTRDADLTIQEAEADDLLETIERFVRRRRFGSVIRVTTDPSMPEHTRDILKENLELEDHDLYTVESPLGLGSLWDVGRVDAPDLKYPPLLQAVPAPLDDAEGVDVFAAIRQHDILLHHPYDSFDPVVDFVSAAAQDPDVLAIKTTLYRVGRNAPVVDALLEAAGNGKQVAALIELKARFDEESNIGWAKSLEQEGVHVIYGLVGLKTHSKIMLVVRNEGDRVRRYVHLGTGNYNSVTSKQYTDLGYLIVQRGSGRRRLRRLQLPDRVRHGQQLPPVPRRASQHEARARGAHRPRDRVCAPRGRGPHHLQDERAHRQTADPQALLRLSGRSQSGAHRARDVLPAARSSRHQRQHHGAQHRRALPRTQPHLLVPQRWGGRSPSRQRRSHAAQSQPARRDPLPGAGSRHRAPSAR